MLLFNAISEIPTPAPWTEYQKEISTLTAKETFIWLIMSHNISTRHRNHIPVSSFKNECYKHGMEPSFGAWKIRTWNTQCTIFAYGQQLNVFRFRIKSAEWAGNFVVCSLEVSLRIISFRQPFGLCVWNFSRPRVNHRCLWQPGAH